ncbi:MAG: DUF2339 domain-containing protein, partial [Segetibacter sp.]
QSITLIIFSCLYLAAWLLINRRIVKREKLHHLLIVLSLFANGIFLLVCLYDLGHLRDLYISTGRNAATSLLTLRYFSLAALAILWLTASGSLNLFKPPDNVKRGISMIFNVTLLSIVSNEFIHWMDLAGYQNQYKLGLSLIWGTYALALLFTGMIKKKKHLRIFAIALFAATFLKLSFYDLVSLSAISKTSVLVPLGIILLVASFLYNKYKDLLFANDETIVEN